MKKLLTLLLALVLSFGCLGLAACNPKEDNSEDTSGGNKYELPGVEYDSRRGEMYVESKEGKTKLEVSITPGYGDEWLLQMARMFLLSEQGTGYYMVLKSDSELTTTISSKLESGMNLSDIYYPLASNWQSYAALDQLESLDSLYAMEIPGEGKTVGEKITGSWTDYGRAVCKGEEHFFVFPGNENITGIVYNKSMFDKYGWSVPATVAELKDLCAKIVKDTNGKVAPFVYPGTVGGGYWDFVGTNWWLQVSGKDKLDELMKFESTDVFNPDKATSPSYGKKLMLRTFQELIVDNRTTYTLKGSSSKSHLQAQTSFLQGQAAMIPNGNWIENESLKDMKDEFRMMETPLMDRALKGEDGEYVRYNYSGQPDYMLIPKEAKNKEGAKKFLAFMCSNEILKYYTSLTGAPRPFDYDISECETTAFGKSCLDVWANSTTWFEKSTSPLWTANKIKKFNASNPYTNLLANAGKVTADGWCAAEYSSVQKSWPQWLEQLGLAG